LQALELRAAGLQWEEIADRMGYADKSGPSNLVRRHLHAARQEAARYVLELGLYRLDRMLTAVWPAAMAGDLAAQAAVLRILDRQAKYLHLDGLGDELPPPAPNPVFDSLIDSLGQHTKHAPYVLWGYQDATDPVSGPADLDELTRDERARRLEAGQRADDSDIDDLSPGDEEAR
jgi:hypothetical protein